MSLPLSLASLKASSSQLMESESAAVLAVARAFKVLLRPSAPPPAPPPAPPAAAGALSSSASGAASAAAASSTRFFSAFLSFLLPPSAAGLLSCFFCFLLAGFCPGDPPPPPAPRAADRATPPLPCARETALNAALAKASGLAPPTDWSASMAAARSVPTRSWLAGCAAVGPQHRSTSGRLSPSAASCRSTVICPM